MTTKRTGNDRGSGPGYSGNNINCTRYPSVFVFEQDASLRYGRLQQLGGSLDCEDAGGLTDNELFGTEPALIMDRIKRSALATGVRNCGEVTLGSAFDPRVYELMVEPRIAPDGNPDGIIGVAVDISDRCKLRNRIRERNEHYRRVVESLNEGLIETDADYVLTLVNDKFCQIVGRKPDELIGRSPLELMPDEERGRMKARWAVRRTGSDRRYETTLLHADGHPVRVLVAPRPQFDEQGRFQGSFAVITDITDLKRAHNELQQANLELRQVLDIASGGIRIVDWDFNVIQANQAFCDMAGVSLDQATNLKCYQSLPGPNCHRTNCPLTQIGNGVEGLCFETRKKSRTGHTYDCRVSATPYRDASGQLVGIVEEYTDVTAYKSIEEDLRLTNEQLQREQSTLQEKNTALRELLQEMRSQRRIGKENLDRQVQQNLKPIVQTLRRQSPDHIQAAIDQLDHLLDSLGDTGAGTYNPRWHSLTAREQQICSLIQQGQSTRDIAKALGTSPGTVEQQRKRIRRKLGLTKTGHNLRTTLNRLRHTP